MLLIFKVITKLITSLLTNLYRNLYRNSYANPLSLLLFVVTVGCTTPPEPNELEVKSPGPKMASFSASFNTVWKASLITLGKYPLKSYDEEAGVIETDFIRGDNVWVPPHKKRYVPGGYKYKINLRVMKGKMGASEGVRVIVLKQPELQKDFFSNSEKISSDGLEELAILYRIEREVALEKALERVKR